MVYCGMKAHQIALHLLLRYIINSSNYKDSEHNKIPPLIAVEVTFQQDPVTNHLPPLVWRLACRPKAVGRWVV